MADREVLTIVTPPRPNVLTCGCSYASAYLDTHLRPTVAQVRVERLDMALHGWPEILLRHQVCRVGRAFAPDYT